MATSTSVTKENLQEFEARLDRLVVRRKKATRSAVVGNVVGTIIFVLCLLTVASAAMAIIMDADERKVLSELSVFTPQWNQFVALLPADMPFGLRLLAGCAVTVVLPFVINLLLHIILLFVPVKTSPITAETELQKARKLEKTATEANYYVIEDGIVVKILGAVAYCIGAIAIPCYITYVLAEKEISALLNFEVFLGSVLLAVVLLIPFGILGLLTTKLCDILYNHKKDKALTAAFSDYVKACQKQEEEAKAREKEEKRQREEAQAREETRKRKEKGAALYAQATATDEIDEDLLKQAADLGDPQASMIIGKRLMLDGVSDMYTDSEKEDLMEKAAEYFENTKDTGEGMLYWLCCRVKYESNSKSGWKEMLKQLRDLKGTGALSEDDEMLCNTTIRALVETIDNMPDYTPPVSREPRLKRKYCRFCGNGSICTFYSTGSYLSLCQYPTNPEDCAAALVEKGLTYEYE